MDKKQFATFAMALKTYYPRENILPNQQAMELWFKHLEKVPYEVAELALQKWVLKSKWSPSISDIRSLVKDIYWTMLEDKSDNEFFALYAVIKQMEVEEKALPKTFVLPMLENMEKISQENLLPADDIYDFTE